MKVRRRKKEEPELVLTSVADIAFLLIVFFVLTSSFMKEGNVPLKLPSDPNIVAIQANPIYVTVDATSKIWVQGQETKLEGVENAVRSALNVGADVARGPDAKEKLVLFRCDASLPKATFEPVIIAISDAGGTLGMLGQKGEKP